MLDNFVIVTARGGEQQYANKNLVPVLGRPVISYPIRAAMDSHLTERVFISTNCPKIARVAVQNGAHALDRSDATSTSTSPHKDVIREAALQLREAHPDAENMIVLLGNSVHVTAAQIDQCFEMMQGCGVKSVMTAYRAADAHPYRAIVKDGDRIKPFLDVETGTNRQDYPEVFYYDQGIWATKIDCAIEQNGPKPWVWLHPECQIIERHWSDGKDIHGPFEVSLSAWYVQHQQHLDHC